MARAHLTVGALLAVLAAAPGPACAQPDAFADAVRSLAAASTRAEPSRSQDLRTAATQLATALAEWDRALEARAHRSHADLAAATGDRQAAIHVELGRAYAARGRTTDAEHEFAAALRLHPAADVHLLRALTLDAAGDREAARLAFRDAWRIDSHNAARAYLALHDGALTDAGERANARAALAQTYDRLVTSGEAPVTPPFVVLAAVPDTLVASPIVGGGGIAEAFRLLAAGRYSDAVAALAPEAGRDGPGETPLAQFTRAQALEADGQVAAARTAYERSLVGTLFGRNTIYVAIGRLAQVQGDAAGAIEAFGQAVRLNPNEPLVHRELAGAYAAQGNVDDAFAELVAALLIDPTSGPVHAAVGQLRLDAGRPEEAVRAFSRALQLNPNGWEVRYALVTALTRLGKTAEAARELAIFERDRLRMLERRRQGIRNEVEREDAVRRANPAEGPSR